MREAELSATCYVALIILGMAFINVEWELPNGTTAVSWTGKSFCHVLRLPFCGLIYIQTVCFS